MQISLIFEWLVSVAKSCSVNQKQMVWLVSIADSIVTAVLSFFVTFFAIILLLFTFAMAEILEDENGQHLYCETSDTGVELCEMREFSLVT